MTLRELVRRGWIPALGVLFLAVGWFLVQIPTPASFGWTAYLPPQGTFYRPEFDPIDLLHVLGLLTMAIGLILIAGWAGFMLGKRRRL